MLYMTFSPFMKVFVPLSRLTVQYSTVQLQCREISRGGGGAGAEGWSGGLERRGVGKFEVVGLGERRVGRAEGKERVREV